MICSRLLKPSIDNDSLWNDLRLKRVAIFLELSKKIRKGKKLKIIDIGGSPYFWRNMGITQYNHLIIDCFNIKEFNILVYYI